MSTRQRLRPIDHCVLPVANLDVARDRLSKLGFTVAAQGNHPFGTANACVYFADNSFLEPLAIVDKPLAAESALKRNVFAGRDATYRFRIGEDGFSALVMGTRNAKADHRRFVFNGMSAGRQLFFSRPFVGPDGTTDEASFRLAFAADPRSPDAFFFTCERANPPKVDHRELLRHANNVSGISRVVMSEPNPADFQFFCQELTRSRDVSNYDHGMDVPALNGTISVLDEYACRQQFGIEVEGSRGLRLRAIVFSVPELEPLEALLGAAGISYEIRDERIVVQPAPGQGAVFSFEAEG